MSPTDRAQTRPKNEQNDKHQPQTCNLNLQPPSPTHHSLPPSNLSAPYGLNLWAQSGLGDGRLSSVAFTGTIHPSSIIHLATDHLNQLDQQHTRAGGSSSSSTARGHVLVLAPSQATLHHNLKLEHDKSIIDPTERDSTRYRTLDRVEFRELATAAHLTHFLNTFYADNSETSPAQFAWTSSLPAAVAKRGGADSVDPSFLRTTPTLVILHNPSEYIAESHAQTRGVDVYASLLALFRTTFERQSPPPKLIVHDRPASDIAHPQLAPEHRPPKRLRLIEGRGDVKPVEEEDKVPLVQVLRSFFDRVGVADRVVLDSAEQRVKGEKRFRMVLDPLSPGDDESVNEWVVAEVGEEERVDGEPPTTAIRLIP